MNLHFCALLLFSVTASAADTKPAILDGEWAECLTDKAEAELPDRCRPDKLKTVSPPYERDLASRAHSIDIELNKVDTDVNEKKVTSLQAAAVLEDEGNDWVHESFEEVVVIALKDRMESAKNALASWGFKKVTVFEAYDKKELDFEQLKTSGFLPAYVEKVASPAELGIDEEKHEYKYTPGRVACHYSHSAVLKYLVNKGVGNALILEDDLKVVNAAKLSKSKKKFNTVMKNLPKDWQVVNFGRCWDSCNTDQLVAPGVVRSTQPLCRNAYAVTAAGAAKLLNSNVPMVRIGDHGYAKHVTYSASPRVFTQDRDNMTSVTGNTDNVRECSDGNPPPHLRKLATSHAERQTWEDEVEEEADDEGERAWREVVEEDKSRKSGSSSADNSEEGERAWREVVEDEATDRKQHQQRRRSDKKKCKSKDADEMNGVCAKEEDLDVIGA